MKRTIFVTEVSDSNNNVSKVYGRFDVIALHNKGLNITKQYKAVFEMSDEDFAKNGRLKEVLA